MLRLLLFLTLLSCAACVGPSMQAGGELIAYPPTDDPNRDPTASEPSSTEEHTPSLVRTRFPMRASVADANRTACSLEPSIVVGGVPRKIDMRIGGVTPCGKPAEGSIRANVFVTGEPGAREVMLELLVPEGATPNDVDDLKQGLRDVRVELERRIGAIQHTATTYDVPSAPRETRRKSARVLLVSEILWAATAAVGTAGLIMLLGGVTQGCCREEGWTVAGASTLTLGAAPLFLGALITLIVAGGMYANEP